MSIVLLISINLYSKKHLPSPHIHHRNPNTDSLIHSPLLLLRRPEPYTYTFHTLHQLLSSHAPHTLLTRQLRYTHYLNHVYHPQTHSLHSPQPPLPTPALSSPSHTHTLSTYTHTRQKTVYASQLPQLPHPHRVPREPHRQTNDDHKTTDTTEALRHSSKRERNLIILQVNINGIKTTWRSSNCLFMTHMQISYQFRKPCSPLKETLSMYITSPPCAPAQVSQGRGWAHHTY